MKSRTTIDVPQLPIAVEDNLAASGRTSRTRTIEAIGYKTAALDIIDHRVVYRDLRNWLAGQALGSTRDESLLNALVRALFARHWLETHPGAPGASLVDRYQNALAEIHRALPNALQRGNEIGLDANSLEYVDHALSALDLQGSGTDLIGDAYQTFAGPHLRGQEGQFFTPPEAVSLLLDLVDPRPGETVIDPACGAGAFLVSTAQRLQSAGLNANDSVASIWGQDKDEYLAQLARARLSFISLTEAQVVCANFLGWRTQNGGPPPADAMRGSFDVVVTNPPFGSKIVAATTEVQGRFALGHSWTCNTKTQIYEQSSRLAKSVPPQVLFAELCLDLVRPGGRVGIVVPESLISGRNYRFVVQWLRQRADLLAIVGMPESLFKTSGKGGTHTKTALVLLQRKDASRARALPIFMAEARWCGNDSRGRKDDRDDLPAIADRWRSRASEGSTTAASHLGYTIEPEAIVGDILAPRYYDPEVDKAFDALRPTHNLVTIGELVCAGVLVITTGHEVGAQAYGTGSVPFVRTSDISNWEIKLDPKQGVSDAVYNAFARKQDVQEGDILMVRDGTYLVGTCAFVTRFDTRIVFQSHMYKLRVLDKSRLSPYLLLAALSCAPVRRQIKAKRFTQDIIDSLGGRVEELTIPIPKDDSVRQSVEETVERSIRERVEARELARQAQLDIVGGAEIARRLAGDDGEL